MTMPLSQNIEVTNDDDGNETMPLMFSCKQRRFSKLNFKRGATADQSNATYDMVNDQS